MADLTYEQILAQQPISTDAGNRAAASRFAQFLTTHLGAGGAHGLTPSQQNYLYKLRKVWEKRAAGLDPDWEAHGSKPGRKKKPRFTAPTAEIDRTAYGAEDELDPLLASIARKYGTPARTDDI